MILHHPFRLTVLLISIIIPGFTIAQENTNEHVTKEFEYELDTGRLNTLQVSLNGPKLIVGERWKKKVENVDENTVLECRAQNNERNYRDLFRTKVFLQLGGNDKDFLELVNKTAYLEYFTVTRQEVWTCASKLASGELIGVIRVKNELIGSGSREISQISFPEGVTISPRMTSYRTRTAVIREVKYLDVYNAMPVRYDGKVKLLSPEIKDEDFYPEVMQTAYVFRKTTYDDGSLKEVDSNGNFDTIPRSLTISIMNQETIILGTPGGIPHGTNDYIAKCEKFQGLNPLPFAIRTRCSIRGASSNREQVLDENSYFDYITPITNELWHCKGTDGMYFFRTVNVFISRKAFGKLEFFNDVVEVREVRLLKANEKGIRVKAIKYLSGAAFKPLKYVGKINLTEQEGNDLPLFKTYDADIKSLKMREMKYILEEGRAYRTLVGIDGFNIIVNSKWQKAIGKKTDLVTCLLKSENNGSSYSHDYGTKIRLLLKINCRERQHAIPRSIQSQYWKFIRQEIWHCSPQDKQYKFLRIVSELEGLKAIYEIQYYEGIELRRRYIDNDRNSVAIVETKYLHPITFEILKYEGELSLKDPPEKKSSFECIECNGPTIGKNENEIVLEEPPNVKDLFTGYILGPLLYDGSEKLDLSYKYHHNPEHWDNTHKTVYFNHYTVSPAIGTANDIAECYLTNDFHSKFYPELELNLKGHNVNDKKKLAMESELARTCLTYYNEMNVFICSKVKQNYLDKEGYSTARDYTFYMVYNSFTVAINCNVLYQYGVSVTYYSDKRVVELTRLLKFENKEYMRFAGKLRVHATKPRSGIIASGTINLNDEYSTMKSRSEYSENGQEIKFELSFERNYKIQINGDGEILNLGTSSSSRIQIGQATGIVKCKRDFTTPELEFKTLYRTKCFNSERADVLDKYFKMYRWEIWDCFAPNGAEPLFKRIVNHFTLQTLPNKEIKIKEILYYDGISVEVGKNLYGLKSWDFAEIVYVSPHRAKAVTYYGKLELMSPDETGVKLHSKPDSHSSLMDIYGHAIQYLLVNKIKIYRKFFTLNGIKVKIGTGYEKVFNEYDKLRCDELSDDNHEYATKIFTVTKFKDTIFDEYKEISPDLFQIYFKINSTRLWQCKPSEQVDTKLLRVETRLEILKTIGSFYHYDGVTISQDNTMLEEIKYIDPSDNKVTRYDGFVRFKTSLLNQFRFSSDTLKWASREIFYSLDLPIFHIKYFNQNGISMHVGTDPTPLGKKSDHAVCQLSAFSNLNEEENDSGFVKGKYYPQMLFQGKNIKGEPQMHKLTLFGIRKYFKVKSRQYWECMLNSKLSFYKVVQSLETNLTMSDIIYYDGITVWNSLRADGTKITTIREVAYYDPFNEIISYQFEGRIININPVKKVDAARPLASTSVEATPAPTSPQIFSNNGGQDTLENIIYMDRAPRKSFVSYSNGIDIRVGTGFKYEVGNDRESVTCELDNTKYRTLDLLTKIAIILPENIEQELNEESIGDYFNVIETEVAKCTKKEDKSMEFLRVVNVLAGKVSIRNIEYYDGVKFISFPLRLNENTVIIVEHKYLDLAFDVIKYAGELGRVSDDGWMYTIKVPVPVYHHGLYPENTRKRIVNVDINNID